MPLPLDKTLKREVLLAGRPFTATISPHGVRLTAKGFRKGRELSWEAFWALARPEAEPAWTGGRASESPEAGSPEAESPEADGRGTT